MKLNNFLKEMDITITNTISIVLFFGSLFLTYWEIEIFRKTFIPVYIPIFLWIFPGIIITPLLFRFLKEHLKINSIYQQLFYNITIAGGITVYTFMAINYFFAENIVITKNVNIIKTGSLAEGKHGCSQPYAEIKYKEQIKELIYPCGTNLENEKEVELLLKKGKLGFEIVINQDTK